MLKKKHDKYAYKDFGDKLALESPDSFNSSFSSSPTDSDASVRLGNDGDLRDDYYQTREIRDTLRLAVSRHRKNSTRQSKHKNGLKEKLMRRDTAFTGNLFSIPTEIEDVNEDGDVELIKDVYVYEDDGDAVEICEPDNDIHIVPDDSSDSLEEKELRLIALKSAVLKKHMERKRRNAEAAYSPTDFDEMMMHETKLADIDVVDLEEDDSQIAVGSPIASPQLMLLDGQDEESTQMVDCKPVDMDIANSDSESGMASNTWGFMGMSHSIPLPPLPPQSDMGLYSYVPGSGDLYLDEFPLNSINPPPPGVDDYEDVKLKQPLMTVEKYQENETEDMELENEFEPIVTYPTSTSQSADVIKDECSKSNSNDGASSTPIPPNDEDLQEEEEELALRALLLAKFQSPKNQKKNLASSEEAKEPAKDYKTNTEMNIRVVKPTEAILKEAVKRLQIHSQLDTHQDNLQRKSPNCVQQPSSFAKEENDYHDIPLPWNPQRPIPIKNEKDCYHDADLLPWDPKHNSSDNFIPLSQDIKEEPKDFSSEALVSLQRKAKELKSNFEAKNVVRTPHDVATTNDIPVEAKETLNTNETHTYQMPISMDEDIKRRLQKLKDEILSATRIKSIDMENSTHQPEYENNKPTQSPEQLRTIYPVLENTCCPRPEEIVNDSTKADVAKDIMHNTAESITATASMESSINHSDRLNDCIKNYLTSSEAEKPTCVKATTTPNSTKINIENSKDDIVQDNTALKENNVNSVNKKNQTPITGIPNVNKVVLANKKVTKNVSIKVSTLSKTKATKSIPNKEVTSSSTVSQISSLPQITVTTTTSVTTNTTKPSTTLPSYSVLRTTKIVKPNKVINRNIDTKRKVILIKSEQTSAPTPAKQPKLEQASTGSVILPSKKIDTSRLITSMEQVKHMCNVAQLVISVQNSSNESSDEEWSNCDSMYRPLTEYNDIASPLSLHMESPCLTPLRSNSPVEMGENKEEKRNQRSPITAPARSNSPKTPKPIQTEKTASQTLNLKTPVVSFIQVFFI